MSEAELKLVTDAKNCTMYTIQFLSDDDSEFEKFYAKYTSFDEMLANTSPTIQQEVAMEFAVSNRIKDKQMIL